MAKSPPIRLLIECLLVAVLGFGIWQLYFKSSKNKPGPEDTAAGPAPKSARFIKDKMKATPTPARGVTAASRTPRAEPERGEFGTLRPEEPPVPEDGILAGVIIDFEGKRMVGPVTVSDEGQAFTLQTFNGEFEETLPAGRYTVTARGVDDGIESSAVIAEIKPGQTQSIQLVLPAPPVGDIGLEYRKRNDWIEVVAVWNGGPAQQAGIQPGDLIIEINGSAVRDLENDAITELLAGPVGSEVEIVMAVAEEDGWVDVPVTLTRAMLTR